jgi:hypothetical protein
MDLQLNIDDLQVVVAQMNATPQQVEDALRFALRKTATKMRDVSAKALKSGLKLDDVDRLRKRLKYLKADDLTEGLWTGTNDVPGSWFMSKPRQVKQGVRVGGQLMRGAFVAKTHGVFQRVGSARLPLRRVEVPVHEKASAILESRVFAKLGPWFWAAFKRDLRARTLGFVT